MCCRTMILFGISDNPLASFQYLLEATLHAQLQNFTPLPGEIVSDKAVRTARVA